MYSRNHTFLNPDIIVGPFWDFSWWENGVFDTPAMLDYVLETTGQDKLQAGLPEFALYILILKSNYLINILLERPPVARWMQ